MLHDKKKQSLLSWVQSAGGHDVTSFSQLSDGKLLNELIITLSDRDCNVSQKSEIDPEETNSAKISKTPSEEEHELIKEVVDFSIQKIDGCVGEQESINGYHDSSTSESDARNIFSHSDVKKEDHGVSENGAINESTELVLNEIIINSDKAGNASTMDLCEVSVNGPLNVDSSDPQEYSSTTKALDIDSNIVGDIDSTEIQGRYNVVQKFIESMLELKCTTLVNISQCLEGHELELAKLTVLLLSAMVQYSLSTNKDHIMASCYSLSPDAQEEIMDCLELFLKERQSPIERKEFHSRLCRRAKLRISPRKRSNVLSTPQPARRGRKRKAYNNMEEFLDKGFESPIQNLIQSPDIRQITPNSEARLLEAVRCKDKTIALLTYDLDMEKYNVEDLKKQNEDLSFQLAKLKNDYKKLKAELNEVQTNLENNELTFDKAKNDWKKEVKSYESQIKDLKDAEKFWKETFQADDISNSQISGCSCSEEISSLKCAMQAKDDKLKERQREVELLTVQLEKLGKSKLEENLDSNNKTSNGRSSIQEKCFNISDLSLRNELRDKCEELQNLLKEREIELTFKTQKIEELLFQKDKVEKECKARLRKTDKEREDATHNQKKLEIENSNLKGQLKIFKNLLPELSSTLVPKNSTDSDSPPANRRSSRNRNVCDSEKIGQLWHIYDAEDNPDNVFKMGSEQDEPCSESSTVIPHQNEIKLSNKKVGAKSRSKLCRSQSVSNISSKDSGTCKICSLNNLDDIRALMQNICKIVREDNILDADVLLELSKYERGFDMKDLAVVLTLLNRILLDFSSNRNYSKYARDLNSQTNQDQFEMSKIYKPEPLCEKSKTKSATTGRSPGSDAESFKNQEILEKDVMHQQILEKEKKKVICLQNKLKNLKHLLNLKTKELELLKVELTKAENLRDTNVERCKTLMDENELKRKKIARLKIENPEPIVHEIIKCVPPPPCSNCIKLKEEIMLLKVQRDNLSMFAERLKSELANQKSTNEDLKRELIKLSNKNSELEEKLSNPKIIDAGVYSPQLKSLRERLKASIYRSIPNELNGSEEMQFHDASTVTNCSFAVSSVGGFYNNNCNESTKTLRAFCKAEDEAEMLSQNSIFEMRNDTPNQRLKEINRRNTLCLPHLKSQYPLELNTTPSQHKYFQPPATPSCSRNMPSRDRESGHLAKKRKISKPTSVRSSFASILSSSRPSGSGIHISSTPKVKTVISKLHKTNSSAARLHYRRFKDSLEK